MEKKIAHDILFEVNGFGQAQAWIYRAVAAGVVKCGQCQNAAAHVFWQDQAEFYLRCDQHHEYGQQWTGSTRWEPLSFGLIAVNEAAAIAWRDTLSPDEQAIISVEAFDATDYYSLIQRQADGSQVYARHYLRGDANNTPSEWVDIFPLKNGEYVYQRGAAYGYHRNTYGIHGAWTSEALAMEAARNEDAS
jgi:hypothetical protein